MEAVLATSNPGKAREARAILDGTGLQVVTVPMWLGEVETGATYLENARLKATAVMRMVRRPVLAEDAGIEVDALHGRPGVRSARFAGPAVSSIENNEKVLRLLAGVDAARRTARYRIVAVLILPSGEEITGEGKLEGRIVESARGAAGFGYDPLFVPDGQDRTIAEMPADEKNVMSHRAQALRQIVTRIAER